MGGKKRLLGFLQLLLVFLLQRESGGTEPPRFSGTGTAGDGSEGHGAADTGSFGKTARNENTRRQIQRELLQVPQDGWLCHIS